MAEDVYAYFEDLVGECLDEDHLGEDGWTQIKTFSFSFGFEKKDKTATPSRGQPTAKDDKARLKAVEDKLKEKEKEKSKGKDEKSWGHSGALTFHEFSFSKDANAMSKQLVEMCHAGKAIPKVVVVMCRPGGANQDKKTEFLRLTFEKVYLKSCTLNLATDGLPTEDMEFQYEVIKIESVWTDNAIGNRRPEQPIRAGWNLTANDGKGAFA